MSKYTDEIVPVKRWDVTDGAHNMLDIEDIEYTDNDRAYIRVNEHFDVRFVKTDEGLVIDIFAVEGDNAGGDPIATTYAFDTEAMDVV
jgi:hypothetical protein